MVMRIKYGKTKVVLIAVSAYMFSANTFAADCNQHTVFSNICVANKVLECTKRYSPSFGNFTYSWEYLTYSDATLKATSIVLNTTLGYTPVSCHGKQMFTVALLPKDLDF